MTDTTANAAPKRTTPRASLGSSEGDDVFGTFDINVARRFLAFLGPHKRSLSSPRWRC